MKPIGTDVTPIEILLVEDSPGDVRLMREALIDAKVHIHLHVASDLQIEVRAGRVASQTTYEGRGGGTTTPLLPNSEPRSATTAQRITRRRVIPPRTQRSTALEDDRFPRVLRAKNPTMPQAAQRANR